MRRRLLPLIARHEPKGPHTHNIKAVLGAVLSMAIIAQLASWTALPLLFGPLGATAVLLFGQPASPLAQPINIVAGYLLGGALAVVAVTLLPAAWWNLPLCVGLAMGLMMILRVTHPPAGAVPILAFGAPVEPDKLLQAIVIGSVCLVVVALLVHRLPPRQHYPRPSDS